MHMTEIIVKKLNITTPIKVVGRVFYGDYSKSAEFIQMVQSELNKEGIPWKPNKVFGVYYDNPNDKNMDELKSFQGVFIEDRHSIEFTNLLKLELRGYCAYAKVSGSIDAIYDGYKAIFNYLRSNNLALKSNVGYQISSFENGVVDTEIYMELT